MNEKIMEKVLDFLEDKKHTVVRITLAQTLRLEVEKMIALL